MGVTARHDGRKRGTGLNPVLHVHVVFSKELPMAVNRRHDG